MSSAVKIGSDLVDEAREASKTDNRSLAGQVEHWAKLGKAVEQILSTPMISALKKSGGDPGRVTDESERKQLLAAIAALRENPPFAATSAYLRESEGPLYESDPDDPEQVVRIEGDGTRTRGRLVGRVFRPK